MTSTQSWDVTDDAPHSIPLVGVVELLAARLPHLLVELRARYPRHAAQLSPGLTLGLERDPETDPSFYEELARRGLEAAQDEIKTILKSLLPRALRAKRLRLLAAIAGTVTSAGVLSSAILGSREMTIVGAALSFSAGGMGLIAAHLEGPLTGPGTIVSLVSECLELEADTHAASLRLRESRGDPVQLRKLALEVNVICSKLRRIAILGVITSAKP